MNRNKLIGVMKSFGDRQQDLAAYIGITQTRLSAKMLNRNGADFTRPEVEKIIKRYSLSADVTFDIFFAE